MRQVPAICTDIESSSRGTYVHDRPVAISRLGNRPDRPTSKGRGSVQYVVVVVDYFTKWVEAEALASITPTKIKEFVYKNIVCQYGGPRTIISNNGTQFDCEEFKKFCDDLQIKNVFSSVSRPQGNGQVKVVNKTIKHNLKTKLKNLKGRWADDLPEVL